MATGPIAHTQCSWLMGNLTSRLAPRGARSAVIAAASRRRLGGGRRCNQCHDARSAIVWAPLGCD
eukprot:3056950-Pyramimonas_sp.AAC.1